MTLSVRCSEERTGSCRLRLMLHAIKCVSPSKIMINESDRWLMVCNPNEKGKSKRMCVSMFPTVYSCDSPKDRGGQGSKDCALVGDY